MITPFRFIQSGNLFFTPPLGIGKLHLNSLRRSFLWSSPATIQFPAHSLSVIGNAYRYLLQENKTSAQQCRHANSYNIYHFLFWLITQMYLGSALIKIVTNTRRF